MSGKENTHASVACGREDFENLLCYVIGIPNLTQDSNLHIVNEQGDSPWIAHLFERLRYAQSVGSFHIQHLALAVGRVFVD
jgi:hypothetical protein